MTTKLTGVTAAGLLAIGIVIGGAGTIVARDDAPVDLADHMRDMAGMMDGHSMGDMAAMMSTPGMADHMRDMGVPMGGNDAPMRPNASMEPGSWMSPGEHESHHALPGAGPTR